jgi:hypothetical protein
MLTGCHDAHDFMVVYHNAQQSLHKLDQEKEDTDRTEWVQFHLNVVTTAINTLPDWAEKRLSAEALQERLVNNEKILADPNMPDRIRGVAKQRIASIKNELGAMGHAT